MQSFGKCLKTSVWNWGFTCTFPILHKTVHERPHLPSFRLSEFPKRGCWRAKRRTKVQIMGGRDVKPNFELRQWGTQIVMIMKRRFLIVERTCPQVFMTYLISHWSETRACGKKARKQTKGSEQCECSQLADSLNNCKPFFHKLECQLCLTVMNLGNV